MSGLIKQIRGWPSEGKTFFDIHSLLLDEEKMNEIIIALNVELPAVIPGSNDEIYEHLFIITPSTSGYIAQAVASSGMIPILILEQEGKLAVDSSEQFIIETPSIKLAVNDSCLNDLINHERLYAVIITDVLSSGETVAAIAKFLQQHGFTVVQISSLVNIVNKQGTVKLHSLGMENIYSYIHINTEEDE